jgi:N-acetylmuramoyl-L-alanine amidase
MAITIAIDPGHGGSDPGAVYNGRQEKDDNLALALAVGSILTQDGYNVVYTRTTDVYNSPTEKAQIANNSGADYFVSFHRNSSPYANTYSGIETLVYNDSGIKAEMARAVNEEVAKVGYTNLGVKERPNLTVLKRTKMPALLIEAGFINTDADNQFFDENFDELAKAIARGIERTIAGYVGNAAGETGGTNAPAVSGKTYRVQTGLFRRFGNAQFMLQDLIEDGFEAEIVESGEYFAVKVGNYTSLEDAKKAQTQLQNLGFDTLIVTDSQSASQ